MTLNVISYHVATPLTLLNNNLGNPVPEIKWLKDGQLLAPDRRHQVLSHGRFLQITGAHVADTGRYSCLASNSAGDRSRHFNLNVLGTNAAVNPLRILHDIIELEFQ